MERVLFHERGLYISTSRIAWAGATLAPSVSAVEWLRGPDYRSTMMMLFAGVTITAIAQVHGHLSENPAVQIVSALIVLALAAGSLGLILRYKPIQYVYLATASGVRFCLFRTKSESQARRCVTALQELAGLPRQIETVHERQTVVMRCTYCRELTPVDLSACKTCGGRLK